MEEQTPRKRCAWEGGDKEQVANTPTCMNGETMPSERLVAKGRPFHCYHDVSSVALTKKGERTMKTNVAHGHT